MGDKQRKKRAAKIRDVRKAGGLPGGKQQRKEPRTFLDALYDPELERFMRRLAP